MKLLLIKRKAKRLWLLLKRYSESDTTAAKAQSSLRKLLESAMSGEITSPLRWSDVPCGYLFVEGALGKYKDLEEAYADFKVEVTGGNDPLLEKIKRL